MAAKYGHVGPKALQVAVKALEPKRKRQRKPTAQPTTAPVSAAVN